MLPRSCLARKTVTIRISRDDMVSLKASGYNLCVATRIADSCYNVIWQSKSVYWEENKLSWEQRYRVFHGASFQNGKQAECLSSPESSMSLGQEVTMDRFGNFSEPSTGKISSSLVIHNNYDRIYPGVAQEVKWSDETALKNWPITYVNKKDLLRGRIVMEPIDMLLVWFETGKASGTMFDVPPPLDKPQIGAVTRAVEIDLTDEPSATRMFSDQNWHIP